MDAPAIIARLKESVPALRKVGVAADLQAVLGGKLADQTGISAFVIALAERGGAPNTSANAFTQEVTETIGIILTFRPVDSRSGDKVLDQVDEIKAAVRLAIAGWAPDGAYDVYALSRGAMITVVPGLIAYTLEFTLSDQLRILA